MASCGKRHSTYIIIREKGRDRVPDTMMMMAPQTLPILTVKQDKHLHSDMGL